VEYPTVCPPCGPGSIPMQLRRSISRDFSLAEHTLPTRPEPAWQEIIVVSRKKSTSLFTTSISMFENMPGFYHAVFYHALFLGLSENP